MWSRTRKRQFQNSIHRDGPSKRVYWRKMGSDGSQNRGSRTQLLPLEECTPISATVRRKQKSHGWPAALVTEADRSSCPLLGRGIYNSRLNALTRRRLQAVDPGVTPGSRITSTNMWISMGGVYCALVIFGFWLGLWPAVSSFWNQVER